jgi:diketogulonate reductase-like aldo/keto reductase
MGEDPRRRGEEVSALRLGLELGMGLVDTAEMYGDGGAEEVVGEAIHGRRDSVFLVSKVLPHNASEEGTIRAAERSLRRLRTDCLDLYLLHWAGAHPLEATLTAFKRLREEGKIRAYGVSNFDADEMERVEKLAGGEEIAVDQVLYNLRRRGPESRLLPWCVERRVAVMAYSPLEQGRLRDGGALQEIARRHEATPEQVALAWVLRQEGIVAIPKASDAQHVRVNAAAARLRLGPEDLADLDLAFPVPRGEGPLERL